MADLETIEASEVVELLVSRAAPGAAKRMPAWIDVRSETEFAQGALPGFVSLPILKDPERQKVGTTFKHQGQEAAIALGHELVDPDRPARVEAWGKIISASAAGEGIVTCWRGGLRSAIAARWMREAGHRVRTVRGGYKAIRALLLSTIEKLPELRILSGLTGSGKTELLRELAIPKIDLEGLANHRGSSFGLRVGERQPSQASFENALGLSLWERSGSRILLEDESRMIGSLVLPVELKQAMTLAPIVVLEVTVEERTRNIFGEYIVEPLRAGISRDALEAALARSLGGIRKKLGGERADRCAKMLREAFERDGDGEPRLESHAGWIEALLLWYYDPMYRYALERQTRKVLFQGNARECREFLSA